MVRAEVQGGAAVFGTLSVPLTRTQQEALTGNRITIGGRPEDLQPAPEGQGLPIVADVVEELGADSYVYGHLAPMAAANTVLLADATEGAEESQEGPGTREIVVRTGGRVPPQAGSTIWVAPNMEHLHLFNSSTGTRLPD
jgi:multiple sugar transport system ATP-binding protein